MLAASFPPASLQGLALADAGDSTQPLPRAVSRELSHTHLAPACKHTLILSLKRLPRVLPAGHSLHVRTVAPMPTLTPAWPPSGRVFPDPALDVAAGSLTSVGYWNQAWEAPPPHDLGEEVMAKLSQFRCQVLNTAGLQPEKAQAQNRSPAPGRSVPRQKLGADAVQKHTQIQAQGPETRGSQCPETQGSQGVRLATQHVLPLSSPPAELHSQAPALSSSPACSKVGQGTWVSAWT